MQLSITTLFFILLLLVLFSGFFSGSEIGMMSLNRYRLRHKVAEKDKRAIRVNTLLTRPDRLLSIILIGNTLANVVASMVATLIGQRIYGDIGVGIATSLVTLVLLVFSEMTPKTLAALHPEEVAYFTSGPLNVLKTVFSPLIFLVTWMANGILRLFGVAVDKIKKDSLSREELRSVVYESGALLPSEHKNMLISLMDLEQATVEDIMVPKSEIVALDIGQPWNELLDQLETAQHTRLPLYRDSMDNCIGIVHVRSVLNLLLDDDLNLEQILAVASPPRFTPEATPLNVQLSNFQKTKTRSCFVVDEYGNLQGLVTMEDILEEVVGEFTTDVAALSKDIIPQKDGNYIVDATITLRQLNRILNWELPLVGPKTLSGLIIEHLGSIPPADCCLRIDSYQIEILKLSDNTIRSVRISNWRDG